MHDLSSSYWNDRYIHNDFAWDIGSVSTPLKEYIDQLTNKELKILIPGAGNAHEAEYLYNLGFKNIYVLDFALKPLENIKARIPELEESHLLQEDFFNHSGQYDLILEQTFFCALNPSLRKRYVAHMLELLKPSAKLAGVMFDDVLNTDQPPFGGSPKEYKELFTAPFHIAKIERCYNSIKPREGRELFVIFQKQA